MIESLQDMMVVSDLDNTLLTVQEGLPECNRVTIQLFQKMGGQFTVASRRSPESIRAALGDIQPSCPVIACGGSVIYDMKTGSHVDKNFLPEQEARSLVQTVMERIPDIGVEIFVEEGRIYLASTNRYLQKHLRNERIGCIISPLEYIPENWSRIVFAGDALMMLNLQACLQDWNYAWMEWSVADKNSCEIRPENVDLVTALRKLSQRECVPMENVVVIGGQYDDINMMHIAGNAVAVDDAPYRVKLEADWIMSDCSDGGAGEYLYSLIKRYT